MGAGIILDGDVRRSDHWAAPSTARAFRVSAGARPEFQGSSIYGLIEVVAADGRPHVVGTISKYGVIYDFTTRQPVYTFTDFGTGTRTGGDSYSCVAYWEAPGDTPGKGWYYFGGWIIAPSPTGTSLDTTNKYTYVVRTQDLVTWQVVLSDTRASATSWNAEVTDLVPGDGVLYIIRGDIGPSGQNFGTMAYDGTLTTGAPTAPTWVEQNLNKHFRAMIHQDQLKVLTRGDTNLRKYQLAGTASPGTWVTQALTSISSKAGGTRSVDTTAQSALGDELGYMLIGTTDGVILVDDSSLNFVPLFVSGLSGSRLRVPGWRAQSVAVNGGVVFAVNCYDNASKSSGVTSYLVWWGPNGACRVLAQGGYFTGLCVSGDKLYFGAATNPHVGNFYNHQIGQVTLGCINIADIPGMVVPYNDRLAYFGYTTSSGQNGWLGGWPTLGYRKATAVITMQNAGNLLIGEWSQEDTAVTVQTIAFTAGQTQVIDLSAYLTGGFLGVSASVTGNLTGHVSFA